MKRLSITLFSLVVCATMSAQFKHYIAISGQVGEASYIYDIDKVSSKLSGGFGNGLHVAYEMRSGAFLLNVGAGANFTHSVVNVGDLSETLKDQKDDDWISGGDLFDYTYTQSSRHDSYSNLSLQVPLMIGAAKKHFYFLAGAKLDVSLLARAKAKALISSSMHYHDYPSPTPDMENHGVFKNALIMQKPVNVKFNTQVMASFEIGYRFVTAESGTGWDVPKEEKNYWRIAVFADYGLLDMHQKEKNDNITFPTAYSSDTEKMKEITINHIFSTKAATNPVNNLMLGIKATYLFQLPTRGVCTVCRDAYRGASPSRSSKGRGRIQTDWTNPK